jgi:hypothetical protein
VATLDESPPAHRSDDESSSERRDLVTPLHHLARRLPMRSASG